MNYSGAKSPADDAGTPVETAFSLLFWVAPVFPFLGTQYCLDLQTFASFVEIAFVQKFVSDTITVWFFSKEMRLLKLLIPVYKPLCCLQNICVLILWYTS